MGKHDTTKEWSAEKLPLEAGSATVEPLKAVEWQFPLGSCYARLSIVADATGEITPEDMDALTEIASLMKRQLVRRQGESQSDQGMAAARCGLNQLETLSPSPSPPCSPLPESPTDSESK